MGGTSANLQAMSLAGCRSVLGLLLFSAHAAALDAARDSTATAAPALTILAPASVGGGWDQTARAMQQALRDGGLAAGDVAVVNSPGAGGAIGLAQFVTARKGDDRALLVGGLTMVHALRANRAAVSLDETTPLARVTGEYEVIAVPAGSELRSLDDLVQALRVNPGAVAWAGGSGGGTDQMLIGQLARALGIEPVRLSYVPFSGGGEVAMALLNHQVAVGVSGYAELASALGAGQLRALAISSPERLPGLAIPTLREQGIPLSLANWRGVFAPPGLRAEQRAALISMLDQMVRTAAWRRALAEKHWIDLYLSGDAFARFVKDEEQRAAQAPDPRGTSSSERPGAVWTRAMWLVRNRNALGAVLAILAGVAVGLIGWQRQSAARRERDLSHRLEAAQQETLRRTAEAEDLLKGLSDQIDRQFALWSLTAAEREVALLMLKGLRHKDIASLRGTSERTVRQQALTIYKKAHLDGRTDLAAFFLEDLLQPAFPAQPSARKSA